MNDSKYFYLLLFSLIRTFDYVEGTHVRKIAN